MQGVTDPMARQLGMHLAAFSQLSCRDLSHICRQEPSRAGGISTRSIDEEGPASSGGAALEGFAAATFSVTRSGVGWARVHPGQTNSASATPAVPTPP